MKIAGIILTVLGELMIIFGVILTFTKYDLSDTDQLSGWVASMAFSAIIFLVGISLFQRARKKSPAP